MPTLRPLEYVNDALFVGLAGVCYLQWRRHGGKAAAWLALTFGALAAVVVAGLALSATTPTGLVGQWATKLLLAAVFLFPYLLFRFTAALDSPSRRTELVASSMAGLMLAATLALPSLPGPGEPQPRWLGAYLAVVVVQWTITSLIVAVRLWRAGRGQPTAARRRMRGLSIGAGGLSLVIVLAGVAPSVSSPLVTFLTDVVTLVSAVMFYLAFAPPVVLRNAWRQPEQAMLRSAMGELKTVTRAAEVAACLLPHVIGMVGGRGAAMLDESGTVLGTHGHTPGLDKDPLGEDAGPATEDQDRPSVRLALSGGWLLVWGSPYTPVFGRQELELLRALGSLADLALERVRVANRDAELAAVVDASGDAIVSTGLDGTIRSWNPAAVATYGRPAEEAIGQPFSIVVPADRSEQADELLRRVGQGERVSLETRHLGGDGQPFSVSLTAAPLHGAAGTVLGMSVVARDVTERKQAERALREAKEEADRANTAKSEYLSRMSHELRTPLNAILGFAQLLELEDLTEEQNENLHFILNAARHLLALINEVLDIAAIEAGRLPLSLEPVAVADVVAETVSLIRPWPTSTRCCWSARRSAARSTSWGTASGSSRSCSTCSPTRSSTTARAGGWSWSAAPRATTACGSRWPTPAPGSPPRPWASCSCPSSGWGASRPGSRGPGWGCRCPSGWPRPWAGSWTWPPRSGRGAGSSSSCPRPRGRCSGPSASRSWRSRPSPTRSPPPS